MITLLLAGTVFHQVLIVELPQNGRTQLHPGDAHHRLLSKSEAAALADSLEGAGAELLQAPSLLEAPGEGAELRVEGEQKSFKLYLRAWKGSTSIDLRMTDGKRLLTDMSARFAIPDGATFSLPLGEHHLLILRQDELADGETPDAATAEFRGMWKSLLRDGRR